MNEGGPPPEMNGGNNMMQGPMMMGMPMPTMNMMPNLDPLKF
jgi:hypothetical protein